MIASPRFRLLVFCVLFFAAACGDSPGQAARPATDGTVATPAGNLTTGCVEDFEEGRDYFPDKVTFTEASNTTVTYHETYKVVEITPLRVPDAAPVQYVLTQCGTPAPELDGKLSEAQVIEVPVSNAVTLTTSNIPHFDAVGMVDRLAGVGTTDFVTTESVRARIDAGDLPGYADSMGQADLEGLVSAAPDLLIIDGFGDTVLADVQRYVDAGIPTVLNADFVESGLLGRAEWLKFTSLFLNAEAQAEAVFADIADAYEQVRVEAAQASARPSVVANTPFEGTWFMPGGQSYFARAIEDANGAYTFADDDSQSTLQLDFETVLDRAADADVWLQAGSVHGTLDDLLAVDARFTEFKAFEEGEVYAYDAWTSPGGGFAVFEVAYTRADWFLADLVKILHPELLPGHELRFFGKVPPAGAGG